VQTFAAVSIAVDGPPYRAELLPRDADVLAQATVPMQPGLRYVRADWPVDDLMRCFLRDSAPATYALPLRSTWVEVHGARGDFEINTLDPATWSFRAELQRGASLEAAATRALAVDDAFDPGQAFVALVSRHLVTDLQFGSERIPQ
jgi:hypothetical protein